MGYESWTASLSGHLPLRREDAKARRDQENKLCETLRLSAFAVEKLTTKSSTA